MAKNVNELRRKMAPERRRRNKEQADRLHLEMSLQELRQGVGELSQADLAALLKVTQGYISRLERQDDMLLSKLYAYVQALGGELEIRARFPDREEVRISQFDEVERLRKALEPQPPPKGKQSA